MTDTPLPVYPAPDHAFVVQPIAQTYLPAARAIATALIYRYSAINTGFGWAGSSPSSVISVAELARVAVEAHASPSHLLQMFVTEWLVVLAAVAAQAPDSQSTMLHVDSASLPPGLAAVDSPQEVYAATAALASGKTVPSLAAMLAFGVNWYGGAVLAYTTLDCGDLAAGPVRQALQTIAPLLPHAMPSDSPVRSLFNKGCQLSGPLLVRVLNAVLTNAIDNTTAHPCAIAAVEATSPRTDMRLMESTSKAPAISPAADATRCYSRAQVARVPTHVLVPTKRLDTILSSKYAIVAHTAANEYYPLLPANLQDAALEYVAVNATAHALATVCMSGTPAALHELRARMRLLYPQTYDAASVVEREFYAKFAKDTPPKEPTEDEEGPADERKSFEPEPSPPPQLPVVTQKQLLVRPGRLAAPGPSMVVLYYLPKTWLARTSDMQTLRSFLAKYDLKRGADGQTFVVNNERKHCVFELERGAHTGTAYAAKKLDPPVAASEDLQSLCGPVFWSVLFMREDLLAILCAPTRRPRELLRTLWSYHVFNVRGRRFDDTVAQMLVDQILTAGSVADVPNAGSWCRGAMFEILLPSSAAVAVAPILAELDAALDSYMAVEFIGLDAKKGHTSTYELGVGKAVPGGLQCEFKLRASPENTLLPEKCDAGTKISDGRFAAWSEPLLRGMCFSTTQLALLTDIATPAVRKALHDVVAACNPRDINMKTLGHEVGHDRAEIEKRLSTNKPTAVDSDTAMTFTTS